MTDANGAEVEVAEDSTTALAAYEECSEEVFADLNEVVEYKPTPCGEAKFVNGKLVGYVCG